MNKKGMWLSLYWFAILVIVAAAVSYMAVSFYGAPYDVRGIEANILTGKIADCLAEGGYLKENILSESFKNNFLDECKLTFKTENEHGWNKEEQYYLEVNFYHFDQNVPNGLGEKIFDISEGNVNLKSIAILEEGLKRKELFEKKRNIDLVIIHYTATQSAEDTIKTLRDRKLSVHYIIDKDGLVISVDNEEEILSIGLLGLGREALKKENEVAEHAGCIENGEKREKCSEECITDEGLLKQECKIETCCIDVNERSIGIELVNLGYLCGTEFRTSCQEQEKGVEAEGKIWENFTEEQIDSLVFLVSDIISRYNIPADREHILGHEEVAPGYKSDPGPAFPWTEFIENLESEERLSPYAERSFYVIDKQGNQYVIKILALVKKAEKNVV